LPSAAQRTPMNVSEVLCDPRRPAGARCDPSAQVQVALHC